MLSVLIGFAAGSGVILLAILVVLFYIMKTLNSIAAVYTTTYLITNQVNKSVEALNLRLWKLLMDLGYPVTFDYLDNDLDEEEEGIESVEKIAKAPEPLLEKEEDIEEGAPKPPKGSRLATLLETVEKRDPPTTEEPESEADEG